MALTPDDVVNKQFQQVRFNKGGFDPDEVDDFLDEVVLEWRKTITENAQLKAALAEAESAPAAEQSETPAGDGAAPAAGIIELAQRLHDEHVAEGVAQRDRLKAEADALLADAREQASSIVAEAEERGRAELSRLEGDRSSLQTQIDELRQFESDYRSQLRSFIESKLEDLDASGEDDDADDDASDDSSADDASSHDD
ncbi:DivIVA domain-containing protein [Microbacterium sp.]|uniref:DivIVA domain-containing protein n=1 Tax=Microbacterium sp. TaxID=51671 RepID=UPI0039E54ABE